MFCCSQKFFHVRCILCVCLIRYLSNVVMNFFSYDNLNQGELVILSLVIFVIKLVVWINCTLKFVNLDLTVVWQMKRGNLMSWLRIRVLRYWLIPRRLCMLLEPRWILLMINSGRCFNEILLCSSCNLFCFKNFICCSFF